MENEKMTEHHVTQGTDHDSVKEWNEDGWGEPYGDPMPSFDVMATIDPDFAESFERVQRPVGCYPAISKHKHQRRAYGG
jgi:hypothetical protein